MSSSTGMSSGVSGRATPSSTISVVVSRASSIDTFGASTFPPSADAVPAGGWNCESQLSNPPWVPTGAGNAAAGSGIGFALASLSFLARATKATSLSPTVLKLSLENLQISEWSASQATCSSLEEARPRTAEWRSTTS